MFMHGQGGRNEPLSTTWRHVSGKKSTKGTKVAPASISRNQKILMGPISLELLLGLVVMVPTSAIRHTAPKALR